jgi:two-component system, cell cycle sensor histidine kinase and response regulator CckA
MNTENDNPKPTLPNRPEVEIDERWRTAFDNSAIGIALLDVNARFVTVNSTYQKMLGYTEKELQTMSCLDITSEEDQKSGWKLFLELRDGARRHIQIEKRLCRKNGTPIWIRLNESLVPGTEKTLPFLLAVVEDITERKQAEDALLQSERLHKEVLNNIPECVFVLDVTSDFRFKFAGLNQAEEKAIGFSSSEVVGKFVEDVLPAEVANKVIQHYRLCLESGTLTEYKDELDLPIGRRYFRTSLIPVRNTEGRIYRIVGCCTDLSEMKRAEEEALVRQKLESLGVLAGGIAHDFNNLLGSILMNAELAETQLAAGCSPVEEIRTIKTVAIQTAEIVRELIVYSGQDQADFESTDVSQLVKEMLELLKVSISKRATLKTDLAKELPAVRGNPSQIRQVLMSLVVNASESFGEKDGVINITTSVVSGREERAHYGETLLQQSEYVRLQVSDTGCGIAEEARAKIFDPFFTTKFPGRGLGLAVVQGIVRAHEGVIAIRSTPGQGTTFKILLPSASRALKGDPSAVSRASVEQGTWTSATVLFVEDEETLRFAISKLLRKTGFSVIEAGDGKTALDLLRSNEGKIDVLLLDMTIPGTPSDQLVEETSRIRPETQIILTSAYHQKMVMNRIESPQIRAFIRKPFRLDEIVRLLRDVLASQAESASGEGT